MDVFFDHHDPIANLRIWIIYFSFHQLLDWCWPQVFLHALNISDNCEGLLPSHHHEAVYISPQKAVWSPQDLINVMGSQKLHLLVHHGKDDLVWVNGGTPHGGAVVVQCFNDYN